MMDSPRSEESHIGRVLSGDTDDSPFSSNLVTPTDEDATCPAGIHERLDAADTVLSYFASKEIATDAHIIEKSLKQRTPVVAEIDDLDGHKDVGDETSSSPCLNTLDSSDTVSSSRSFESLQNPATFSIYTLPNSHINVSVSDIADKDDATQSLLGSDSFPIIKQPDLGVAFWRKEFESLLDNLTFRAIMTISIRLLCFLPWCAAVGGALVLSPEHLEYVAFRPGYMESLSGIRRYAYWAEYGHQHIMIFLGALVLLTWVFPSLGVVILGGLLAQFCAAWHAFLFDENIPLGEDDQQSVFLLAKTSWFNDTPIGIRKVGDSYYLGSWVYDELDETHAYHDEPLDNESIFGRQKRPMTVE